MLFSTFCVRLLGALVFILGYVTAAYKLSYYYYYYYYYYCCCCCPYAKF